VALTSAAVASLFVREDEDSGEARLRVFEQNALAELRSCTAVEIGSSPGFDPIEVIRPRSDHTEPRRARRTPGLTIE